jgi:hypothetical protein
MLVPRRKSDAMKRQLLFLVVTVACGSPTPETETAGNETTGPSPTTSAPSASPLEGEWDTGPIPADDVRAAIIAAGYGKASADEVVRGRRHQCNSLFYEEVGVPFVAIVCWDPDRVGPTPPLDRDHGPYELLPGERLKLTCDVCDIETRYSLFSYELQGSTLTLRFIRWVDPELTPKELRYEAPFAIAQSAAPYHRVG